MASIYNVYKGDAEMTSPDMMKGKLIMLKKLNHYFKGLIFDRTEEIGQKILSADKRYRELNSQIIEVQRALMKNLPPQSQSLVYQYDEAEAEQDSIVIRAMYRQGFIDGLKLTKLINEFLKKNGYKSLQRLKN